MWVTYFIDVLLLNINFNKYGILPRTMSGLFGVLLCPFLHANLFHLISNTIPIFILIAIITFFFRKNDLEIITLISVLGGAFVWVFGRSCYHVGASILIFGLASFIIFFGLFSKRIIPFILTCIIILFYGTSLLIGLLPIFPGVSWEGHISGSVAGFIIANVLAKK